MARALTHRSIREALNHLREYPQVEIHTTHLGCPAQMRAVFRGLCPSGLAFDVIFGPHLLVGRTLHFPLDGGTTDTETSIEFHAGGFVIVHGANQTLVSYRQRRPWDGPAFGGLPA